MNAHRLNRTEAAEREYLEYVTGRVAWALQEVNRRIRTRHAEMKDLQSYLQENKADLDHAEKASVRQSVNTMTTIGEQALTQRTRLSKLLASPYFGRIDIDGVNASGVRPTYIGMHALFDAEQDLHLVHDWRAPISSVFYEFELGPASYEAPEGQIDCQLLLKRQYRIEGQQLKFMLESSLNIQDDVLQEELSRASDEKMKNIVATIQRDQNAIIRNDEAHTLIIQGAAGSGKTSIALHRIAFLLYKYRDSIRSEEILIISPNKVFAHYISQVLPELGEEMIQETTMEQLADELLEHKVKFQLFSEQVSALLKGRDEQLERRIAFKSTPAFLRKLDEYGALAGSIQVTPRDVQVGVFTIAAQWIGEQFLKSRRHTASEQITDVLNRIVERARDEYRKEIVGQDRTKIRAVLKQMVTSRTLKGLYRDFYDWLDEPAMFQLPRGGKYEYADVFPLVYLKMLTEGVSSASQIKHVVIDEMQDYTPIQYEVIGQLYACKKTILGDHNQAVSPLSASSAEKIREVLPGANCMYMHKSYRSTLQITELAQCVQCNPDLVPIERHGEKALLVGCHTAARELARIGHEVQTFLESDQNSLGIICKVPAQAIALHKALEALHDDVRLLDADSTKFSGGVMVTTALLAKGLEFDHVILPHCTEKEYCTLIDRHMLYVGCTRAMHRLVLTYCGTPSPLIAPAIERGIVTHEFE